MTKYRPAAHPASPSSWRDVPIRPAAEFCHGAARRDTPVICLSCGRTVPRNARQQRYCSDRCRERGRDRSRKTAVEALKNAPRYPHSGAPTNPLKNINGHNGLQPWEGGSSIPRSLLHEIEIFSSRRSRSVISSPRLRGQHAASSAGGSRRFAHAADNSSFPSRARA